MSGRRVMNTPRGLNAETKSGVGPLRDLPGESAVSSSHECSIRSPLIVAADEFFWGEKAGAHLPGTEGERTGKDGAASGEKKPIKVCNKNDKRLFIKREAEKVNIYHFGFYLVDLENISAHVARLSDWCNSE